MNILDIFKPNMEKIAQVAQNTDLSNFGKNASAVDAPLIPKNNAAPKVVQPTQTTSKSGSANTKGTTPTFNFSAIDNPNDAANKSMLNLGQSIHTGIKGLKESINESFKPKVASKVQNPTKIVTVDMPKTGNDHNDKVLSDYQSKVTDICRDSWIQKYTGQDIGKAMVDLQSQIDRAPSSTNDDLLARARMIAEYQFLEAVKNYGVYSEYDLQGGYDQVADMDRQIESLQLRINAYDDTRSGHASTMNYLVDDDYTQAQRDTANMTEDDYEQMRADLAALQQYRKALYNEVGSAKNVQLGSIYASIAAMPNIDQFAKQGAMAEGNKRVDNADKSGQLYSYMTDDEAKLYDAIYAASGEDAADTYYKYLGETLKQRKGGKTAEKIENIDSDFVQTLAAGGYGLYYGTDNALRGIWSTISGKEKETKARDYAVGQIREDLGEMNRDLNAVDLANGSNLSQAVFDATTSTGNMVPMLVTTAALGALLGPTGLLGGSAEMAAALTRGAGAAVMGTGVYGNVKDEMLKQGYNPQSASTYAAMNATLEVGLESVLGGFDALGGAAGLPIVEKQLANINNAALRYCATMAVKVHGEGKEEYLQDVLDPLVRNLAFAESNDVSIISEEGAYSYIVAAMSVFGSSETITTYNSVARCEATGAYVNAVREANPQLWDMLINDALASKNEEVREFAENLQSGEYALNNGNVGELILMMKENGHQTPAEFIHKSADKLAELNLGPVRNDARSKAQEEWETIVAQNPGAKVLNPVQAELKRRTGWDVDTADTQGEILSKIFSGIVPTNADIDALDLNNQHVRDIFKEYTGLDLDTARNKSELWMKLRQGAKHAAETEAYQNALKEANEAYLQQRSEALMNTEFVNQAQAARDVAHLGMDIAPGRAGLRKKVTAPRAIEGEAEGFNGLAGYDHDSFVRDYMEKNGVDREKAEEAWNSRAVVNDALFGGNENGEQVRSEAAGRVADLAERGSASEVHEGRAEAGAEAVAGNDEADRGVVQAGTRIVGKVISKADYNEAQRAFDQSCQDDGFASVTLVDGDIINEAGQVVNAVVDIRGNLTISATDPEAMTKVGRHERIHLWLDSFKTPAERVKFVNDTLRRILPAKTLESLYKAYAAVYSGAYAKTLEADPAAFRNRVYEEILADMFGGMDNYGARASAYNRVATTLIDESGIRNTFLSSRDASTTETRAAEATAPKTETTSTEVANANAPPTRADTIEERVARDINWDDDGEDLPSDRDSDEDLLDAEDYTGEEEDLEDAEFDASYLDEEYYSVANTDEEIKDKLLTPETRQALDSNGLTIQDGIVVSNENAELMRREGYQKPQDWTEQYSIKTEPQWEKSYREQGGDPAVADAVKRITDWMIADTAVHDYLPHGEYAESKFGPLRANMEYIYTFDMDASCPRTFQYVYIRDQLQRIAKRPLTFNESINLLNVMKKAMYMIPCTYCYVENKRILKSNNYLNYFAARDGVMSAKNAKEARSKMYSYNPKKGTLGKAAEEVFNQWRQDVAMGEAFHPSADECWNKVMHAQMYVSNWLDGMLQLGQIQKNTPRTELLEKVNKKFKITDAAAIREVQNFVDQWIYETNAEIDHNLALQNIGMIGRIDQRYLTVHNAAMQYANSASSARSVDNYVPYTDQLKNVSEKDRAFVMGMGGIRKHSSNDFRMDYVQDYLMFYADLAAGKWTGHTYTKSVDFCKIFGRTGDRINLSIAFDTKNGEVVMNDQEGANWDDAKKLRKAYYDNLGTMAMVTDNLQLSFALNTDWIDMIIPFHASGLPKEVWKNMKAWNDYTSKQLERFLNKKDMVAALKVRGISAAKMSASEVADLYNKEFGIKMIYDEKGKRKKPHFFPEDTYVEGPGGEMQLVPGHHNDVETYFRLCEEYGVHPRFYGLNVTNAQGEVIPVTEHPNYLKLIKETARTETEQHPIEFNLDQHDDYLGMSPMEYIMERLQQAAKSGGYDNMKVDKLGIIDIFKNDYLGKDRPLGYLSERAQVLAEEIGGYKAYEEIEANALGLNNVDDLQKLHESPEAMGLDERYSVAGEAGGVEEDAQNQTPDQRVEQAKILAAKGTAPSEIFKETGLTVMMGGNIIDPTTGEVLGRIDRNANRNGTVSAGPKHAGRKAQRGAQSKVPQNDRRGIYQGSGIENEETAAEKASRLPEWGTLTDSQQDRIDKLILQLIKRPGNELFVIRETFDSGKAFTEWLYEKLREDPSLMEAPLYGGQFADNAQAITDILDAATTEQTDARTDNGDGRFSLDEDAEQEPVISPEVAAQEIEETDTRYSIRTEDPPKKTLIGYKVFAVDKKHPGQLYPTKVDNPGGQGTPVGVWLNADTGEIARNKDGSIKTNSNGRIAVKADGGSLAWRPGWHLGSLPEANQMNRVDPNNPESKRANRDSTGLMWDNYVFCECEFAADEDYQLEAFQMGFSEKGSYKHTEAGLPYLPKDGYYKYRTNPNPNTAPWFISGAIKITKILDDDMRREIIDQWNREHPDEPMRLTPRYSGKDIDLSEYGFTAGPVTPTENLDEIAPGVDYSDEIKDLPGYRPNHINWDNENFQNAFKINGIEDRKEELRQKYEANQERYSVFSDQVDEVKNNTHNPQQAVVMGQTPRPLSDVLWLPKLPMFITPNHVYSMAVSEAQARAENRFKPRTNYHDLGWDVVKQIPEQLAHPVMIIKSNTDPSNIDVLVLTDLIDKQGRPVAVAIHPDGRGKQLGLSLPENAVLSGYGRNNVQNYIARAKTENRILYANKNNHQRGSRGVQYSNASAHNSQGVWYSNAIMSGDYSNNLAQYQQIVKAKFKGTIFENSVGLRYSVSDNQNNPYPKGSLENTMLDLARTEGAEGVENWINDLREKTEQQKQQRSAKPTIPKAGTLPPVGKVEREIQRDQLDGLLKKYGRIKEGEKPARQIALPKKTDADKYVPMFYRTAEEASATPERMVEQIDKHILADEAATYARITDAKAVKEADDYYNTHGYEHLKREWPGMTMVDKMPTKLDMAKGERLFIEAARQGDDAFAMRVVADLTAMSHAAGQTLQAARLLKKMGPIGQLYYFQKAVDRLNFQNKGRIAKGSMAPIRINQKLAREVILAETQEDIDKAMKALIKDTANQLPVTLKDKWDAWRYLAMLGNPRTHIRNLAGNAVFWPVRFMKDLMAASGEAIFIRDKGQRTKSAAFLLASPKYKGIRDFAASDFATMEKQITGGGKMNPLNEIMAARDIFKFKPLNKMSEANSKLLEVEDVVFLRNAYVNAMSQYLVARGLNLDELTSTVKGQRELNQARQYAAIEAQKATYRDFNAVATALNRLKDLPVAGQLLDGLVPFTKTPMNILKRGIEYSPIGLMKSLTYDLARVKRGDITAAEAIDHIAAGMTGTMIAALGVFLASQGIARGAGDDDEKKDALEKAQGHQDYSLEIGGKSFTIDWMAPVALPFFVGVEAYNTISEGGSLGFWECVDALTMISDPMLSLSMLDGINNMLTSASYSENHAIQSVVTSLATSYLSQGLPTFAAQIARTMDPYRRSTYVDKNDPTPAWMQRFLQTGQGKIPKLAEDKMAYVDMWGRKQTTGSVVLRAFENFVFPWYQSDIRENAVEHELMRLAKATGDNSVLPSSITKSFSVDGETVNLTAKQYENLKIVTGRTSYQILSELMTSPVYAALDDAEKAKAIQNALTVSSAVGRQSINADYAPAAWVQRAIEQDNFEDAVVFHTMQSMDSGLTNYQLIECMYWLPPEAQGKLILSQFTPQAKMTDYTQKGHKFILDDSMKARQREIYEEMFWESYNALVVSSSWANAGIADRAEMVKKMQTELGKQARSFYGDELRRAGVTSVLSNDPETEAEEIAAMINELGYQE